MGQCKLAMNKLMLEIGRCLTAKMVSLWNNLPVDSVKEKILKPKARTKFKMDHDQFMIWLPASIISNLRPRKTPLQFSFTFLCNRIVLFGL